MPKGSTVLWEIEQTPGLAWGIAEAEPHSPFPQVFPVLTALSAIQKTPYERRDLLSPLTSCNSSLQFS